MVKINTQLFNNKFIVFEGLDGTGKTTIIDRLNKNLNQKGKTVKCMHFPNAESYFGKIIYDKLFGKREIADDIFETIYLADMIYNLEDIYEGITNYDYLIMDRYFYSTLAYSYFYNTKDVIKKLSNVLIMPNDVFYVRLPVEECVRRLGISDADEIESNKELLECVSKGYDELSSEYGFKVLDGKRSVEENVKEILREIK